MRAGLQRPPITLCEGPHEAGEGPSAWRSAVKELARVPCSPAAWAALPATDGPQAASVQPLRTDPGQTWAALQRCGAQAHQGAPPRRPQLSQPASTTARASPPAPARLTAPGVPEAGCVPPPGPPGPCLSTEPHAAPRPPVEDHPTPMLGCGPLTITLPTPSIPLTPLLPRPQARLAYCLA